MQKTNDSNMTGIRALMLFFVLEYVRPFFIAQLKLQMAIVVLLLLFWFKARDRPWSGILTAQVLFLVVIAIATPFASNYYAVYVTTRTIFGHLVIALGISWLMSIRADFRTVIWAWLLIMAYAAIFAIVHHGTGPGAFLGDENDLALGCSTALPFAFYGFERFSGGKRWISGFIGVLLVIAALVSFSRGGFLGLAGSALYCLATSRRKLRNVVVVAVLVAAIFPFVSDSYIERIQSIQQTDEGTAKTRKFLWTAAFNMWQAHPIMGVGGGNFTFLVGDYQPADYEGADFDIKERSWSGQAVHSFFFQVLSEEGTAGILLIAYIVWTHFRILRRLRRDVRARSGVPPDLTRDTELYAGALAGAMIGYCVAGFFLAVAYYPYLWYFSGMAVALDTAVRRELAPSESRSTVKSLFERQVALSPSRLSTRRGYDASMPLR